MSYPYKVARTVIFKGEEYAPDTPIRFDMDDRDEEEAFDGLLASEAILDDPVFAETIQLREQAAATASGGSQNPPPADDAQTVPLSKLRKPELLELAEKEQVELPQDPTVQQIIAAIEAKRAAA
ncbi:hypothetical protein [Sphingomonas sp. SORGH_AS_0879]|uniref:hypothetical protein n=1 Tax=Sphingomonas sp. SORGH_AS_0879 TaxID=3041790 RepID=UPI002780A83D|nr:hypothetical protein [Sphingomonas sp. SORGH_AS_0879]MDQ1229279.1 hypothetical protein [Sphingomonas sp. SORGH_AS_0879]